MTLGDMQGGDMQCLKNTKTIPYNATGQCGSYFSLCWRDQEKSQESHIFGELQLASENMRSYQCQG